MTALIEMQGVTKTYGAFTALNDVTLSLSDTSPSMTAVAGESGSGKTTLARMMLGFINPSQGQVL
ncbi:MAG: transporter, partial [Devosia sp.]|nr:transporter [Devosia sp.]